MTFVERITGHLELSFHGETIQVESRQISSFSVKISPWGFSAEVQFRRTHRSSEEDSFLEAFLEVAPCEAHLKLSRTFGQSSDESPILSLRGLAIRREIDEIDENDLAGVPVLTRLYTLHFLDRAQAAWSQHRPTMLLVDTTYQALFNANLVAGIKLSHNWSGSSVQYPTLSIGLGSDENPSNFYDFIAWFADHHGLGFFHDPTQDVYQLRDSKLSPRAVSMSTAEVASIEVYFPPVRRAQVTVLNGSTLAAEARKEIVNKQSISGVKAEFLVRTPIASRHDARASTEIQRAKQRLPMLRVTLRSLSEHLPIPGETRTFSDGFSPEIFAHGTTYRITTFALQATEELEEQGGIHAPLGRRYQIHASLELEQSSDPVFHLPPFVTPIWPFYVEGTLVSEVGKEDEETFQIYQEQGSSLDVYRVKIPIFDSKQILVLFEPMTLDGQFFLPIYKGARVQIALHLDRAELISFLDWRPGGRLPIDLQGNHLLFGKKASSQTSVSHTYLDAKPVLKILRTQEKDEQTILIQDGTLLMTTRENS